MQQKHSRTSSQFSKHTQKTEKQQPKLGLIGSSSAGLLGNTMLGGVGILGIIEIGGSSLLSLLGPKLSVIGTDEEDEVDSISSSIAMPRLLVKIRADTTINRGANFKISLF